MCRDVIGLRDIIVDGVTEFVCYEEVVETLLFCVVGRFLLFVVVVCFG